MVASTYNAAMMRVFADEGGYSNDKGDPAGCTQYGCIRADIGPHATCADVRALTKPQAQHIYDTKYAAPMDYNDLPAGVDYTVLDYSINSGISRSGRVLRQVVGMPTSDWHVTPDVIAAVKKRDPDAVIIAINAERLRFLQSLGTWRLFKGGWSRRVAGCKSASLVMQENFKAGKLELGRPDPPLPDTKAPGKGTHPAPTATKNTIGTGTGTAGGGLAYTFFDWISAHPYTSAAVAFGVLLGVYFVIKYINDYHHAKNVTPMPGTTVVPESA